MKNTVLGLKRVAGSPNVKVLSTPEIGTGISDQLESSRSSRHASIHLPELICKMCSRPSCTQSTGGIGRHNSACALVFPWWVPAAVALLRHIQ